MDQHTPGPWSAERKHPEWDKGVDVRYIDAANREEVCVLFRSRGTEAYYNTKLIAAAPEMLDVLRDVAENTVSLEMRAKVYAVIEKATR